MFFRITLISFQNNIFQSKSKAQLRFFSKSETTFTKQLCPNFFMFSVLGFKKENKKAIENRAAVYFCLNHEFLGIFDIFTMFFRDSEKRLEGCDSYGDFGCLTKNQTVLFEEKFVNEHIVLLL